MSTDCGRNIDPRIFRGNRDNTIKLLTNDNYKRWKLKEAFYEPGGSMKACEEDNAIIIGKSGLFKFETGADSCADQPNYIGEWRLDENFQFVIYTNNKKDSTKYNLSIFTDSMMDLQQSTFTGSGWSSKRFSYRIR